MKGNHKKSVARQPKQPKKRASMLSFEMNAGLDIEPNLSTYVDDSWKTIEERQITFDETDDINERVRLRNLITQQKARMYTSIR